MSVDRCVCCGEIVPEGRQVCLMCEATSTKCKCVICGNVFYRKRPNNNQTTCSDECRRIRERQRDRERRERERKNRNKDNDKKIKYSISDVFKFIEEYKEKTGVLLSYGKAVLKMEHSGEKR